MALRLTIGSSPLAASLVAAISLAAQRAPAPELLLRLDDVGMSHSVNMAIAKVAARASSAPRM